MCFHRLDTNAKTTWHINPNQTAEVEEQTAKQGHNLMAVAAKRVWEELYISYKRSKRLYTTPNLRGRSSRITKSRRV